MIGRIFLRGVFALLFVLMFNCNAICQIIAITPAVCEELQIPDDAKKILNQKLLQMATKNGFGAIGGPFVLTANVNTVDKTVVLLSFWARAAVNSLTFVNPNSLFLSKLQNSLPEFATE